MTTKLEKEFVSEDGYDLCVSCKTKTEYKTDTPINERRNYTEGGQLCDNCGMIYGGGD